MRLGTEAIKKQSSENTTIINQKDLLHDEMTAQEIVVEYVNVNKKLREMASKRCCGG